MMRVKSYLTLCRLPVSFFIACSAATGFFLGPYERVLDVLVPAAAVFLLASGASAMNQWQEQDIDARMERTRRRPLPAGAIAPGRALVFSCVVTVFGLVLLAYTGGMKTVLLGLLALLWYNGVYTYLKRISAFAAVWGAAVGMVPPAIGWVAAGGALRDARLAALCFIFFLWQIPHFWLLLLRHGEDYRKAGLPMLFDKMTAAQISRVTFTWIFAASTACLLLPLYGAMQSPLLFATLVPAAAWLVWNSRSLAGRQPPRISAGDLFPKLNTYLFLLMALLSIDTIFFRVP